MSKIASLHWLLVLGSSLFLKFSQQIKGLSGYISGYKIRKVQVLSWYMTKFQISNFQCSVPYAHSIMGYCTAERACGQEM